jgi:hypothetical protein
MDSSAIVPVMRGDRTNSYRSMIVLVACIDLGRMARGLLPLKDELAFEVTCAMFRNSFHPGSHVVRLQ